MKIKKIIVLFTTVCMLGGLVACGGDDNTSVSTNDNQTVTEDNSSSDTTEENNNSGSYDEITEDVVRNHAVTDASDFEYEPETDADGVSGVRIMAYSGTDTIVVIPEEIDGKPVIAVSNIFWNESPVQGVLIPSGVKKIGAIFGNNKCIEVVIAEGIEVLGQGAMLNCEKLHTVVLGEALKEIEHSAFGTNPALKELYIPKTVETIPAYGMVGLKECTIKGESGSYIETYCSEYDLKFEAVE